MNRPTSKKGGEEDDMMGEDFKVDCFYPTEKHALRELEKLSKALFNCMRDVEDLHGMSAQEANVDDLVAVMHSAGRQVEAANRFYCKSLRKQVATESYRLVYLLRKLKEVEDAEQWRMRKHGRLYRSLLDYHDTHFAPPKGPIPPPGLPDVDDAERR